MYREMQRVRDEMETVQAPLRSAILAEDTREITRYLGEAQAAANQLLRAIEEAGQSQQPVESFGEARVERSFVDAAAGALSKAVVDGERVAAGSTVSEMRDRLLGFKTHVDFAHAYVLAAIGGQIE